MPHELLWESGGVHKRFWGHLSGQELADSVEDVAAHPDFAQLRFILNDFLGVIGHALDLESMERVAISRLGSRFTNPRIRVALVTTNAALFALADVNAAGSFLDTNETKAFASLGEARAWVIHEPPILDSALRPTGF